MPPAISRTSLCRLLSTCSSVSDARFTLKPHCTTTSDPSMRVLRTSRPVKGPNRISSSCGYCDNHDISAPRLTMPCLASMTMPGRDPSPLAYPIATPRSRVVDIKPFSTPPLTPNSLAVQNVSGSFMPLTPRYTFVAIVSLPSLITALLMPCNVVQYLLSDFFASSNVIVPSEGCSNILAVPMYASAVAFGQQSETIVLRRKGTVDPTPRKTELYLTNIGPVYMMAAISSSTISFVCLAASSRSLCASAARSTSANNRRLRQWLRSGIFSSDSAGHDSRPSLASAPASSSSVTKSHSALDVVSTP
mmetsp:Transcript_12832/g.40922  ORF Transcript_12832/g.40922 Transcript_12832/m.40922 type:complete len:305 (+) Transcript_12832:515-1429(+)